jgi:hypothetical protein
VGKKTEKGFRPVRRRAGQGSHARKAEPGASATQEHENAWHCWWTRPVLMSTSIRTHPTVGWGPSLYSCRTLWTAVEEYTGRHSSCPGSGALYRRHFPPQFVSLVMVHHGIMVPAPQILIRFEPQPTCREGAGVSDIQSTCISNEHATGWTSMACSNCFVRCSNLTILCLSIDSRSLVTLSASRSP